MARSVEWAMRVEAQRVVDGCRQCGEIDAAGLSKVARGERAGDWACSRPKSQRIVSIGIGFDLLVLDRRAVPILEIFNRVSAAHTFDRNQPIDLVAVRTAAEAVVMIGIDAQARRAVFVKWTAHHPAAQWLRDQVRGLDALQCVGEIRILIAVMVEWELER